MVALRRTRLKVHHELRLSAMCGVLTGMMTADGPGTPGGDSIWPHMISILRPPSDRRAAWAKQLLPDIASSTLRYQG